MLPLTLLLLTATPASLNARGVLEKHCAKCHGGAEADEGGFDFLFERDALVRERFVVPHRPQASRLVQRVGRREMPPPEAWAKVAPAEQKRRRAEVLAALEVWIREGAAADGFDTVKAPTPLALSPQGAARLASDDLAFSSRPASIRWFTVNGPAEEVALAKALNSLSWAPALVHLTRVAPGLVRVNLGDLGLKPDDWESTVLAAYPFGLSYGSPEEETLSRRTDTAVPIVRADWFVATATRPPLYHALARIPANEPGLESALDVRVKDDVNRSAVVRVGFSSSGVSQNNRLIERHTTRFGPYWRSYDFASNVGAKNLFERPLTFVHDGGEHIFSLPNGLFGFMLTDARGGRIERGPTTIVRDPRRPDGAVENGLSCMGCHARGFIPKADQVGPAVRASTAGFTPRERRAVELLHRDPETVSALFEVDTRPYLAALDELGVKVDEEEPITKIALQYERDLDLSTCAHELGVSPGSFTRALERGPEALAPLRLGGTVKRDAFVAAFPQLVSRLRVGTVHPMGVARHVKVTAGECGLSGPVEARVDACALAFPDQSRQGLFRLVARDGSGHEVWLDEKRQLLWSSVQQSAPQATAAERCARESLVEGLWFLPNADDLEGAMADGLPGDRWGSLWSRDVDQRHKYDAPGFAVNGSGRRGVSASSFLPSRCATRI